MQYFEYSFICNSNNSHHQFERTFFHCRLRFRSRRVIESRFIWRTEVNPFGNYYGCWSAASAIYALSISACYRVLYIVHMMSVTRGQTLSRKYCVTIDWNSKISHEVSQCAVIVIQIRKKTATARKNTVFISIY